MSILSRASRRPLRDELAGIILQNDPEFAGKLTDTTSLIQSGLVDSHRLLDLALFVEREIGRPVDLTTVNLTVEWDTIHSILGFIEKGRLSG